MLGAVISRARPLSPRETGWVVGVFCVVSVILAIVAGVFAHGANGKAQGAVAIGPVALSMWALDWVKRSRWSRAQRNLAMALIVTAAVAIVIWVATQPRTDDVV